MQEDKGKNTEISERILILINLAKSNPNDFAKRLGYGRSQAIYDVINGKAKPSFDFFQKLLNSEYSDIVDLAWLITGRGSSSNRIKPIENTGDVDLISRPNSRPISKSEDLGLQKESILSEEDQKFELLYKLLRETELVVNTKNEVISSQKETLKSYQDTIKSLNRVIEALEDKVNFTERHTVKTGSVTTQNT